MGDINTHKGDTNIHFSGENKGQIINNENGTINNHFQYSHYSSVQLLEPKIFNSTKTDKTPETERLKATGQVLVEIISVVFSMTLFQVHWALGIFLIIVCLGFIAMSLRTFDIMKILKKQGVSDLPPMMAIKYPNPNVKLRLDEDGKIILSEIVFSCPKCNSDMVLKSKEKEGYSLICPRNNDHSFSTFDFTTLDKY